MSKKKKRVYHTPALQISVKKCQGSLSLKAIVDNSMKKHYSFFPPCSFIEI